MREHKSILQGRPEWLAKQNFALVLCSPMQRARETCELAGLGAVAVIDHDLAEWNYGKYEGITTKQIHETAPGWLLFRDGCPGGETPEQVGGRGPSDRRRARGRWRCRAIRAWAHPAGAGSALDWVVCEFRSAFLLDTGTLCVLGYYRDVPAVRVWNGPLIG